MSLNRIVLSSPEDSTSVSTDKNPNPKVFRNQNTLIFQSCNENSILVAMMINRSPDQSKGTVTFYSKDSAAIAFVRHLIKVLLDQEQYRYDVAAFKIHGDHTLLPVNFILSSLRLDAESEHEDAHQYEPAGMSGLSHIHMEIEDFNNDILQRLFLEIKAIAREDKEAMWQLRRKITFSMRLASMLQGRRFLTEFGSKPFIQENDLLILENQLSETFGMKVPENTAPVASLSSTALIYRIGNEASFNQDNYFRNYEPVNNSEMEVCRLTQKKLRLSKLPQLLSFGLYTVVPVLGALGAAKLVQVGVNHLRR